MTRPPRILVVEDNRKVLDALVEGLRLEGWEVERAATGTEALGHLGHAVFHLVVLDWMLPDQDGLEVLRHARARGMVAPVLMVTARGTVADRVKGFDHGADDYLVKPFAFEELLARCRALLRRPAISAGGRLVCGDLELDRRGRIATRGGEAMALTPLEVDLLEYLLRRQGEVVTREMLRRDVWRERGDERAGSNAINIHMVRLRQKVDREPWPRIIHTLHGVGYRCAPPSRPA